MKQLTIVRHSKAAEYQSGQSDHDRPLAEKGVAKAEYIAAYLKSCEVLPDLMVSSTAQRAYSTAEIYAATLGYPVGHIIPESQLYGFGGYADTLAILKQFPQSVNHAMIFGHNPTFTALAWHLCSRFRNELPTCATVGLELPIDQWSEIEAGEGQLSFFYTRRIVAELRERGDG